MGNNMKILCNNFEKNLMKNHIYFEQNDYKTVDNCDSDYCDCEYNCSNDDDSPYDPYNPEL